MRKRLQYDRSYLYIFRGFYFWRCNRNFYWKEAIMIDLQYFKDRISETPESGIMSAKLESVKLYYLVKAVEEAKQIMQLNRAAFSTKQCSAEIEWLSKYFEQPLNEDQVELERLKNE